MLTFVFLGFIVDFAQNQTIRSDDDNQGKHVYHDKVKNVVRNLVRMRRKEVEGDALDKPREVRMLL